MNISSSCPLLIPEIAHILCEKVDARDLLNVALTCKVFCHAACGRMWRTLYPRSHMALRRIKNTLEGKNRKRSLIAYHALVSAFRWAPKEDVSHTLELQFFNAFRFSNLLQLEFSYAAAQDATVAQIMAQSRRLRYVDLSHCYCLSTEAIQPLLRMPLHHLETLILYGCGKIEQETLANLITQHQKSLICLKLTDIDDHVLGAIQACKKLQELGLEHCSDTSLTSPALGRFCQTVQGLHRLRMRDISNLTSDHLRWLAESNHKTLQHIDLSECVRISSQGFCQMAVRCVNLQQLFLAYQSGVTNEAMKFIIQNCHRLKELDLSGCRLLTDDAFEMLLEESDLYVTHLESVNLSGLESEISSTMIQELLLRIPTLQEICLGVAYDYNDATAILDRVNGHRPSFYLDVEKCHTICRMHYAPLGL